MTSWFVPAALFAAHVVVATAASAAAAAEAPLAEPWRAVYAGPDSSGRHVLGHWRFEPGAETKDSGPAGLAGKLVGAVPAAEGKFGGALESFPGWPIEDKQHALVVPHHPSLSPSGAFTVEMWVRAKPDLARTGAVYLLDKKYASLHDYQWMLGSPLASGLRPLQVNLGFGEDVESYLSDPIPLATDAWQHLAFSYDGAGTVRFFRDGSSVGKITRPARRGIAAGTHGVSIGDRLGSNYGGFPGFVDEVRICRGALEFNPASVQILAQRSAWVRGESAPALAVTVRNLQSETLRDAKLTVSGAGQPAQSIDIPSLESGATHEVSLSLDTSLRPDSYDLQARLHVPSDPPATCEDTLALTLVPRPLPHRMPVLMWGIGGPEAFRQELPRLKHLGFTHCLGLSADYDSIWKAEQPVPAGSPAMIEATSRMLDLALVHDMRIAASLYAGYYLKKRPELSRVGRDGKPYARQDCNAALPGLAEFCERVGTSVARTYGGHPAFAAALINSEVRDDSQLSFSDFDRQAYRQFSGQDIPEQVQIKNGVLWSQLPGFPANRVIPDDHPILQYYRWFWTVGDGWNQLHTSLHEGLKSTGRDDIWTWYDPAIRVPSIGGSGGAVDVLGQWTYTEPSPLRVGYFCDELLAMAAASPRDQRVMKMTQLFWYRSTSAPIQSGQRHIASPFDDHDPDAAYISIAPMHLRGAFWSKLSRPISGLMYHGWSSLVPTDGSHAYKYTQPDLQTEFRRLHREVLEPLGPTLLQVPDRPSDVAYLNSFTSQMFARRGSYGYSHDEAYLTLLHAQLQPEVIFEQTLLAQGLDRYKLLVLVDCDVLTEPVAAAIQAFQRRGGIVVGDPNLAPAIQPDIVLPRFTRTRKTAEDKATILANAAGLRSALDARYERYAECTDPEIVTRVRSAGDSDYVFVVNDRREFGSYVGQHGLVMEQGLPGEGRLSVRRPAGWVYDLRSGREVSAQAAGGALAWPVQLGPCDGNLFLVTPQPIERVVIDAPATAARGSRVQVTVRITDASGRQVPALIPLELTVTDPHGRPAERTGWYGAAQGQLAIELELASNDVPGVWEVLAREAAAGTATRHYLRVLP
ncbi:MAG: hypothetical protein J5I93_18160 [Pirellulaceae bacterium]|nr:hypothetical protein [Pirellulaceae bacterium]